MKYIVFSDIHGNQYALNQLLEKFIPYKEMGWIFLGDIWGYFYGQEECILNLKKIEQLLALKGNHDQYYLDVMQDVKKREMLVKKYGSSYSLAASKQSIEFLDNMLEKEELSVAGKKILCIHGGVNAYLEERIYPDDVRKYYAQYVQKLEGYDYILSGHTHYKFDVRVSERTRWINPGSLGQPRDGKGFSYAIIDFGNDEVQFEQVQCDIEKIKSEIREKEISERNRSYLLSKIAGEKE